MWWGGRAYKVTAAGDWNCGLFTGGEAMIGLGWRDRNVKKELPCVIHMSPFQKCFSNPTTASFLYPFNMMDTRLGACWSLLHDLEHLHFPVMRVRILKMGILGPLQSKMEVLQVPGEGKIPTSLAEHILLRSRPRTCSKLWMFKLHIWLPSGTETWRSKGEKHFYGRLSDWKTPLRLKDTQGWIRAESHQVKRGKPGKWANTIRQINSFL